MSPPTAPTASPTIWAVRNRCNAHSIGASQEKSMGAGGLKYQVIARGASQETSTAERSAPNNENQK